MEQNKILLRLNQQLLKIQLLQMVKMNSKNLSNDTNETSNESSSVDENKKVNDKTKGTVMGTGFERGAGGGDYELTSSLSWLDKTKIYTPSEIVDKIQKDKEYYSDNNVPLMKKSEGTVAIV